MMDARQRPRQAEPAHVPLLELISSLLRELPGLVSDRLQLLTLELKRASRSLGKIAAFAVVAAILLFTAWVTLWIGIGLLLVALGLHWGWSVVIILALNIGAAVFLLLKARALVHDLTLPATMRRLDFSDLTPRPTSPPAHTVAGTSAPTTRSASATHPVQP